MRYSDFYRRPFNIKSTEPLELNKNKLTEDLEKLINRVFNHQKAIFHLSEDEQTVLNEKYVASIFYKNGFYVPSKVKRNGLSDALELDEFINDVFFDRTKGNKNKLCFLLGDVGVGKTAYINNIITNQNSLSFKENNIWLVRLDFEKALRENFFKVQYIINQLVEKSKRIIENEYWALLDVNMKQKFHDIPVFELNDLDDLDIEKLTQLSNNQKELYHSFVKLFFQENGKKLAIVIDNIDVVYHKSLKGISEHLNENLNIGLVNLIYSFLHDNNILGDLHANILFVMRNDSFNFIKSLGRTSLKQITEHPYRLIPLNWDKIINIRYNLLIELINQSDFKNTERLLLMAEEVQNYLLDDVYSGVPLISHIREMTNYGLRDLIDFFNRYSWITYQNAGINRLIEHYHVGLISYFLGGNKLYRESDSDFPNFFSVNPDSNSSVEKITETPQSYWLKYLIVRFIDVASKEEAIDIENIYSVFGGKGDNTGTHKYYNLELVKEVVECLGNANKTNVIRIKKVYNPKGILTQHIELTRRGSYILNEFVFKFIYLQLIVDDQEMKIPRFFKEDSFRKLFDLFEDDCLDYSYILQPDELFSRGSKEMIYKKGKEVIVFLSLLQGALYAEEEKYPEVFSYLKLMKFELPDMKRIIERVIDELRTINKTTLFVSDFSGYINDCLRNQANIIDKVSNAIKND